MPEIRLRIARAMPYLKRGALGLQLGKRFVHLSWAAAAALTSLRLTPHAEWTRKYPHLPQLGGVYPLSVAFYDKAGNAGVTLRSESARVFRFTE